MSKSGTTLGGVVASVGAASLAFIITVATVVSFLTSPVLASPVGAAAKVEGVSWGNFAEESFDETAEIKERQAILYGLNEAMQNNDREAFIAWGVGEGQKKLANWWDITKQIGWENGSVDGINFGIEETFHEEVYEWFFSSELGASIISLHPDEKGLVLTQGEYYLVQIKGDGEEARIIDMVSKQNRYAWSALDGEVHIAKRPNSVTVGKKDEAAYVEMKADQVEEVSKKALTVWPAIGGGELPTDGILVQVSENQSVLDQWVGPTDLQLDYSGLALTSQRPMNNQPYISPEIATGERTSGSLILMSPRAEGEWETQYESILLHEIMHAYHRSAYPVTEAERSNDIAGAEGFSEYVQMKYLTLGASNGIDYYDLALDHAGYRENIANLGYDAFSADKLRNNDTAAQAYIAAALAYDYATTAGLTPWQILYELTARETSTLTQVMSDLSNGTLHEDGYVQFVRNG